MTILKYIAVIVIGYLLGTISVGATIARLFGGVDIRKQGSGNSGSTNVLRTLGWLPGVLTLVGDCLKGYVSCMIGQALCGVPGMLLGGLFAVIGHVFPVFTHFKGGKGVATTLGLALNINPWMGWALLLLVIVIVAVCRYMSIASLIASVAFVVLTAIICRGREYYAMYVIVTAIVSALLIYCHRSNIQRLINHEENRLDFKRITEISKHKK